eukprot:1321898-Rhodomonas_salina.2
MSWRPNENEQTKMRGDVVDFRPEILMDLASQAPPTQERAFELQPPLPLAATMYSATPATPPAKPELSPRSVVDRVMRERYPQRAVKTAHSDIRAAVRNYAELEKMHAPQKTRAPQQMRAPQQQPEPMPRRMKSKQPT